MHDTVPHTEDKGVRFDFLSLTLELEVAFPSVHGRQLGKQMGGVETHGERAGLKALDS